MITAETVDMILALASLMDGKYPVSVQKLAQEKLIEVLARL